MDCIRLTTSDEMLDVEDCLLMVGAKYDIRGKFIKPIKAGR